MGAQTSKVLPIDLGLDIDPQLWENTPLEIRDVIVSKFREKEASSECLKEKYERLKVDSEQSYFELERQLITSNEKLEVESKSAWELRQQLPDLEKKYAESSTKVRDLLEKLSNTDKEQVDIARAKMEMETEKQELKYLVERKTREVDQLTVEWNEISQKLNDNNVLVADAQTKLNRAQSLSLEIEYKKKIMDQEKLQLQSQNDWLSEQLKEKTNELLTVTKEQSGNIYDLQNQLEIKTDEVKHLQSTVESLRETQEDYEQKIENYIQKLKETRDIQIHTEEQYRNELTSQEKLINLYQSSAGEAESKVTDLIAAVDELQQHLKEAAQAHTELQKTSDENIRNRDETVVRLERELKDANELMKSLNKKGLTDVEDVEGLCPSVAVASRMLKSGLTITQIYSEYVQLSEALHLEKDENERLNMYIDKIIKDVEEKAPIIKRQREEFEKYVEINNQLTSQLTASRLELEHLQVSSDDATRRCREMTRENHRLRRQSVDLSQQVRVLLKELEEARGTVVSTDAQRSPVSSGEVTSSSHIITQRLVSFRSIEELQEQNQRLLEVVRDLSEKHEQGEEIASQERTTVLQDQLETALQELENMKNTKERQAQLMESIIRQRDSYRLLVSQGATSPIPATPSQIAEPPQTMSSPMTPVTTRTPKSPDNANLQEAVTSINNLHKELNKFRKEKEEEEKLLNAELDKLRQQVGDLRVQNAKFSSQVDFSTEKNKILETNIDTYKKELTTIKEKNQKLMTQIVKYEENISTLKKESQSYQERMYQGTIQSESMRAELESLRSIRNELVLERDCLSREQKSQNLLMSDLQVIKNNLEKSEFETRTRLQRRIENLEKENFVLTKKLQNADPRNVDSLVKDISESKEQLEEQLQSYKTLNEEYEKSQRLTEELKEKVERFFQLAIRPLTEMGQIGGSNITEESLQQSLSGGPTEELQLMTVKYNKAETEIEGLKEMLTKAQDNCTRYQTIASTVEQHLVEQNQTSKQFQESVENQLKETIEARNIYQKQVEVLLTEKEELCSKNVLLMEDYQKKSSALTDQLTALQKSLDVAEQGRCSALTNELEARQDCETQSTVAQQTQEKYERELMLHATDIEALNNIKEELKGLNEKVIKAEDETKEARAELTTSQDMLMEKKKMLEDDQQRAEDRVGELQTRNYALHRELEALSEQMVKLQQAKEKEDHAGAQLVESLAKDESGKSADQLLEVIRFLRKEKEIYEGKFEDLKAECTRLKQQLRNAEFQLEEVQVSLVEEREKAQAGLQTAAQHADLMRKVANLNLLQESNVLLREEKDRILQQLSEMEAKAKTSESEIGPMQASLQQLTGQRDLIIIEKNVLQEEVDLWKARTNSLTEQYNKTDPEELHKLEQERDHLKKRVSTLTEENSKQRAESVRLAQLINRAREEETSSKQEIQSLNQEVQTQKTVVETKEKEVEDKNVTIIQLKKIGRKYRLQAEETQKSLDELRTRQQQQQGTSTDVKNAEDLVARTEAENKILQEKLTKTETESKVLEENLKKVQAELVSITEDLGSAQYQKNESVKMVKDIETKAKELEEKYQQVNNDLERVKELETKAKDEATELEKKQLQSKVIIQRAQSQLTSRKELLDKLNSENRELKARLDKAIEGHDQRMRNEYECRLKAVETQLNQARQLPEQMRQEMDRLKKENTELQLKVQLLQKQLENQAKQPSPATKLTISGTPVEWAGSSSSISDLARTANIRPSVVQTRHVQSAPVQPVRSAVTETRAMASIRPIPVSAAAPSQTPTATVMPTTVSSLQEGEAGQSAVNVSQPANQVRPTQQVQPVSPHIEETSSVLESEASGIEAHATAVTEAVSFVSEPMPSTSGSRETESGMSCKRQREDDDLEEDSEEDLAPTKKSKANDSTETLGMCQELDRSEETPSPFEIGTQREEHVRDNDVIGHSQQQLQQQQQPPRPVSPVVTDASRWQETSDQATVTRTSHTSAAPGAQQQEEDHDDVIIVGEEEDTEEEYDDDEEEIDSYDEEEEDYEEGMEEADEDYEEGEGTEDDYEEHDDTMGEEEDSEDNDVVIVDDDEDGQEAEEGSEVEEPHRSQVSTHPTSIQSSVQPTARQLPSLVHLPTHPERFPSSTSNRTHVPPFALAGEGGFEVGDDGIVPSTPTLQVPRRTDGFAEAVSSPRGLQRFVFGSSVEAGPTQSELAQQEALGMDDTSMDLSQFDDAEGTPSRAMPSGAARVSTTPSIAVIEASPPTTQQSAQDTQASSETQQTRLEQTIDEGSSVTIGPQTLEPAKQSTSAEGEGMTSGGKPKIQKIIWDKPGTGPRPPQTTREMMLQSLAAQRRFQRGGVQSQRGRPIQRQGGPPRGGTIQRGRGGSRGRGGHYRQQPHQQPPF